MCMHVSHKMDSNSTVNTHTSRVRVADPIACSRVNRLEALGKNKHCEEKGCGQYRHRRKKENNTMNEHSASPKIIQPHNH